MRLEEVTVAEVPEAMAEPTGVLQLASVKISTVSPLVTPETSRDGERTLDGDDAGLKRVKDNGALGAVLSRITEKDVTLDSTWVY